MPIKGSPLATAHKLGSLARRQDWEEGPSFLKSLLGRTLRLADRPPSARADGEAGASGSFATINAYALQHACPYVQLTTAL